MYAMKNPDGTFTKASNFEINDLVYTPAVLQSMTVWERFTIGIYTVRYNHPSYDADTHYISGHEDQESGMELVITDVISELPPETIAARAAEKAAEAEKLRVEAVRAAILEQESKQARAVREFLLAVTQEEIADAKVRLGAIEIAISDLRKQL